MLHACIFCCICIYHYVLPTMSRFPSDLPAIEFWICVNGSIQEMTFSLQLRIILLIIHVRQLVLHPVQVPVMLAKRVTTSEKHLWGHVETAVHVSTYSGDLLKGMVDWTAEGEPGAGISNILTIKTRNHRKCQCPPILSSELLYSQLLLLLASLVSSTLSYSILSYSILSYSILSYFIVWVTKSLYIESLPTKLPLISCHHFSNLLTLPFRRGTLLSPIEHWWSSPAKSQILCGDVLKKAQRILATYYRICFCWTWSLTNLHFASKSGHLGIFVHILPLKELLHHLV